MDKLVKKIYIEGCRMFEYIVEVPYESREECIEIGLELNRMPENNLLVVCFNKKRERVLFYIESMEDCLNKILNIQHKMKGLRVFSGKSFWGNMKINEWVIYELVDGLERCNSLRIQKLLETL